MGLVIFLAVIALLWDGFIRVFGLDPYFAKSPQQVWNYLMTGPDAAANRSEIGSELATTLLDAALGYVSGTVAAIVVANGIVWQRSVEQTLMPLIVTLRSVPLVAMTPLIALVFGRGLLAVTVVGAVVTFFPTLVNLVHGLRSVSPQAIDLLVAYGASQLTVLRKAQMPSAIPALFASARIAAPGALLGAILAEWLVTGDGLGNLMLVATSSSRFDVLWASVVIIAALSIVFYVAVGLVEAAALGRYAPDRS
jgi:ABC-type nitrate/sulfonate/bicarbonate transport system permease component